VCVCVFEREMERRKRDKKREKGREKERETERERRDKEIERKEYRNTKREISIDKNRNAATEASFSEWLKNDEKNVVLITRCI